MKREECLNKAKEFVCGKREEDYGNPENNFSVIADLWETYLTRRNTERFDCIMPYDVAIMLSLLKIARLMHNPEHKDSWADLAGYSACGCEITTED